jgi:DNA polymerase-3 subunit delta
MVRQAVAVLLREHDPDGTNTTRLDGKTVTVAQASAIASTPGFLGQPRVTVIDDLMARAGKGSRPGSVEDAEDDGSARSRSSLALAPLFDAVAPGNILILVDPSLSSIPAAIRKISPKDTRIIAGDPPRGRELLDWIRNRAHSAGSAMAQPVAQALAELLFPQTWSAKPANPRYDRPPDLAALGNEVDKLALAAHPGPIERHHVHTMVEGGVNDRLFPFVEAAVAGDLARATRELNALQANGEDPHRLTAQLIQQIELAALLQVDGVPRDPVEAGRGAGLANPNRMFGISKSHSSRLATHSIPIALVLDRSIKRGALRSPEDVLYGLVAELAGQDKQRRGG